ncbi:MAG TPA: hypothetical protein H9827_08020, partial [Candidatus Luteimonas excrementigallinarum]|nr:hypothetical protein [Candidatus Luteimonas excrementigallinarum]
MRYPTRSTAALLTLVALAGCGQAGSAGGAEPLAPVPVQAVSSLDTGAASQAVVVLGEQNGADVRIVAAADTGGLVVADFGGRVLGTTDDAAFEALDV